MLGLIHGSFLGLGSTKTYPTLGVLAAPIPGFGLQGRAAVIRRRHSATGGRVMTIKRHEPSKIYSKVVEANGFVYTAGIVADDVKQDVKGQTQQILKEIDRLL